MHKGPAQKTFKHKNTSIKYLQTGKNPQLLIISGTHGDEYKVINLLKSYLGKNFATLPFFIFIPVLSPSALKLKTRENKNGNDLNRQFLEDTTDEEAIAVMDFLKEFKFKLCLDFHEDKYIDSFYLYDSGSLGDRELKIFKNKVSSVGTKLYSGIDDPKDKHMGYHFKDGYASLKDDIIPERGCFWDWVLGNDITGRVLNFETPTKEDEKISLAVISEIFNFVKSYLL